MNNPDLVAIGDLMIDFTCCGQSDAGMLLFERNPGGAPMNVAAQVARLGGNAASVACVGNDEHGVFLRETMASLGVDTTNVQTCREQGTRLLFVYVGDGGERSFTDYRGARADLELSAAAMEYGMIARAKVLLYSPLCNTPGKPIREATLRALVVARENGVLLAFDPNYRFPYEDETLRRQDITSIAEADILKMTAEEFRYYLDEDDIQRGVERLLSGAARIVAVSMGRDGCLLANRRGIVRQPGIQVTAVDTTGAGDSFMGALIYQLTRPGVEMDALTEAELTEIADFANTCAGLSTTRRGALLAMPGLGEVQAAHQ